MFLLTVDNSKPVKSQENLVIFVNKKIIIMTIQSNRNFNTFILIQPQFFCNYPFLYNLPLYLACVAGACKQWEKERTGAREGDTRGVSLLLARPFFLAPTTSKCLLRGLPCIHYLVLVNFCYNQISTVPYLYCKQTNTSV